MKLGTHQDLKGFISSILSNSRKEFPLKVLGQRKPAKGKSKGMFYSASLLAEAYKDIPDPDTSVTPIHTHFGKIHKANSELEEAKIYSQIENTADKPWVVLQGDILNISNEQFEGFPFKFSQLMVLSHSCDIYNKSASIVCCPVLYESEIDQKFLEYYKGKAVPDFVGPAGQMLDNFTVGFIGLPVPSKKSNANQKDERMLATIGYTLFVNQALATESIPNHRLTYRGLAYLQQRLGMFYFRDVQDSDDCRDL